jgi:hypothetical protein
MKTHPFFIFLFVLGISAATAFSAVDPPATRMCQPGELLFSDDFDPATVSERWFFKGEFALRDGALLRTTVDPTESKRVFLGLRIPQHHHPV